jgi:hypothetical protein
VIEVAPFDMRKIINPELRGADYQHGVQKDSWNTGEYVLVPDGQSCPRKKRILDDHHIESRKGWRPPPG